MECRVLSAERRIVRPRHSALSTRHSGEMTDGESTSGATDDQRVVADQRAAGTPDEAVQQAHPAAAGPDTAGRPVLASARLDGLDGVEADVGTLGLPTEVFASESAVVQL